MLLFADLIAEVKRMAIRDQAGTEFDNEISAGINESLLRIAREVPWKPLRRTDTFDTTTSYTTGTGAATVTSGSKAVTVTGATFLTNSIEIGRRISLGGSNKRYTIKTITGETTLTVDINYDGTTSATQSYSILPKEEYTLPAQATQIGCLWHEAFGYPYVMQYVPNLEFLQSSTTAFYTAVPRYYREWNMDMVLRQPNSASAITVVSSATADIGQTVTVFGIVSSYPDQETISLNGTSSVAGLKSFTTIDRVVKNASSTGRISCTSNSGNVTVAIIPTGDGTAGIMYNKVRLWPLPSTIFPMNVWYYKQPWRLVNDADVHELGQEFDHAIILLTTAKIRYQNNQKEGDRFYQMYTDELKSLKKTNGDKLDFLNVLKRPEESRGRDAYLNPNLSYGQLGGQFGPMSFR